MPISGSTQKIRAEHQNVASANQNVSGEEGRVLKEYKEFITRGNIVDLAVAVVIGAAFGKIIDSLVKDVVMPPIGLILGRVDFTNLFFSLNGRKYASLAEAQAAAAPTINYGIFINTIISFLIVAFVIFLVLKQLNRMRGPAPAPELAEKECPYCRMNVPLKAVRCPHCTSTLQAA